MRNISFAAFLLLVLVPATQIQAEVIKLICNRAIPSQTTTVEVDMEKSTVVWTWMDGSHPVKQVPAQITDQYVTWRVSYNDKSYNGEVTERLDRQTGTLYWWNQGRWDNGGVCERAGKPVF